MKQRHANGHTLIEVLVAIGLFAIMGSLLINLFVSGARLFARGETRLDTQSAALVALTRLTRESRASAFQTLTVTDSTDGMVACAFRLAVVPGSVGPFVVYWFDPNRHAIGRVEVPKDVTVQRLMREEVVSSAVQATQAHLIAQYVQAGQFAVVSSDGSSRASTFPNAQVHNPSLSVQITVNSAPTADKSNPDEVFSISVGMRNKM